MIQEDYITFEQAKLLKEKGFPQGVDYYDWDKTYFDTVNNICLADSQIDEYDNSLLSRPTLSLVQKWLREEKNIDINISCNKGVTYKYYDCYIHEISDFICDKDDNPIHFNKYEEALSAGIDKALKLI